MESVMDINNIRKNIRNINVNKIQRDISWKFKQNPTEQDISLRRVQLHVDKHGLEMYNECKISAVELLKETK